MLKDKIDRGRYKNPRHLLLSIQLRKVKRRIPSSVFHDHRAS